MEKANAAPKRCAALAIKPQSPPKEPKLRRCNAAVPDSNTVVYGITGCAGRQILKFHLVNITVSQFDHEETVHENLVIAHVEVAPVLADFFLVRAAEIQIVDV